MDNSPRQEVNRRQFLIGTGLTLAGAALSCGRGQGTSAVEGLSNTTVLTLSTIIPAAPPERAADLVLLNGTVITVDAADTITQAVAVREGLIQAVGRTDDVTSLVGETTRIIDLGGRAVTPGLIDPHNHLQIMGLMGGFFTPFLPPEVRTIADLQAALAEVVAQTPEGEWVQGYFIVVAEGRLPDRHDLDPVSPNNPVWILQQGGHYGSANSLALEIAGITPDTPDPVGGVIARDDAGEPTGVFYNHRAMDVLRQYAPRYTMEMVRDNITSVQPIYTACGMTSCQDNNVRGVDTVDTYLEAGRQGEMILRGAIYYTLEWPSDVDRALNEIEHYEDDFMRFAGFKFLLDGQLRMAYCHEPHNGERWDTPTWEPQSFREAIRALHDTGLQICVHCGGDAATDLTLDAFEEAMNANPRSDPRHRIEHAIITRPESTQRMVDLGVVVSTQPQFIRLGGDGYADLFGEERARRAIVTREWLDAGVVVALGSDAPTTPWYTPQVTLTGAVTRVTFSNERLEPDQAMTIEEALRAHTIGAAYAAHEEDIKGSIEVGKLADLAVWSQNPYTTPMSELWETPIDMTLIDGEIVYESGESALAPHQARDLA